MLPVERFQSFIEEQQLFKSGDKVLAAVSGGRDSVLMALLLHAVKADFGIAHCNFHLRGTESKEDELFCRRLAESLDVPFFKVDFDTAAYADKYKVSTQMAARELRYNWFEEIRDRYGYSCIALAHHQNDSVETVLLNLVRGTGISGLHGILPKRGRLIRPLLFLTREEIDQIIEGNQISCREDSSNQSEKYARNKLRLKVIPQLKMLNPSLEETFRQNSARFAALEAFLEEKVQELRKQLFVQKENVYEIDLQKLKTVKPLNILLYELFKPFGFSESVTGDLIRSWGGQPGKIFDSPSHQILLDRDKLFLYPAEAEKREETEIHPSEGSVRWKSYKIGVKETSILDFKPEKSPKTAYFDAALLHFPLKIRSWKAGDYFYPFGMSGRKKISDFFTAEKVPLNQKNNIPILTDSSGDILWVCGYRSDGRYKITSRTRKVIIFEVQN